MNINEYVSVTNLMFANVSRDILKLAPILNKKS